MAGTTRYRLWCALMLALVLLTAHTARAGYTPLYWSGLDNPNIGTFVADNGLTAGGYPYTLWGPMLPQPVPLISLNGSLSSHPRVEALSVNGIPIGWSSTMTAGDRATRWDALGNPTELPGLGTSTDGRGSSTAKLINASGVIAGLARKYDIDGTDQGIRPVRWNVTGTEVTELGLLSSTPDTYEGIHLNSINDVGTIVGALDFFSPSGTRAVRWTTDSTQPQILGDLGTDSGGQAYGEAMDINANGGVIGQASIYDESHKWFGTAAIRWDESGSPTILQSLGIDRVYGLYYSRGKAINDSGTAVGSSSKYDDNGYYSGDRPVRWDASGTAVTELEMLNTSDGFTQGAAVDINNQGLAVGWANLYYPNGAMAQVAVLWDADGHVTDLNTLVSDLPSGWQLSYARQITDTGWIAGEAMHDPDGPGGLNPEYRNWLMQIPEPASWSLTILALAGWTIRRRPAAG